jgi:hypothetical protein
MGTEKLNYLETMWAEMKPDIYGGESAEEHIPLWYLTCLGDKGDVADSNEIQLAANTFPPGTKIVISVPCCPKCDQEVEMCQLDEGCDFDWHEWTEGRYS